MFVLEAPDVEFVMPHLRVRYLLQPGDLVVWDPCLPHGLCRPADNGRALNGSFQGPNRHQDYLSGELQLSLAQWERLDCPWVEREHFAKIGAIDLVPAAFNPQTGAVQTPSKWRLPKRPATRAGPHVASPVLQERAA